MGQFQYFFFKTKKPNYQIVRLKIVPGAGVEPARFPTGV